DVGERSADRAHRRADGYTEQGDEEQQPEQETPERSRQRAFAREVVQLAGPGTLAPGRPRSRRRVVHGDETLALQVLERRRRTRGTVGFFEPPDRQRRHRPVPPEIDGARRRARRESPARCERVPSPPRGWRPTI